MVFFHRSSLVSLLQPVPKRSINRKGVVREEQKKTKNRQYQRKQEKIRKLRTHFLYQLQHIYRLEKNSNRKTHTRLCPSTGLKVWTNKSTTRRKRRSRWQLVGHDSKKKWLNIESNEKGPATRILELAEAVHSSRKSHSINRIVSIICVWREDLSNCWSGHKHVVETV